LALKSPGNRFRRTTFISQVELWSWCERAVVRKLVVLQMEVWNWCKRAIVGKMVIWQMEVGNWCERSIIRKLVERIVILDTASRLLVDVLCSCGLVRHVYRCLWHTELQGIG